MVWLLLILLVLLTITYDDFKHRSVRLMLFPVLAALLFFARIRQQPRLQILWDCSMNLVYIFFLSGVCYLYLKIRYKKVLWSHFVGMGDILFILCLAIWFEPVYFIVFNSITFFAAMLFHVVLSRYSEAYKKFETVPLAGYQSFCFSIIVIAGLIK
jgi:hypothetical protein